MLTDRQRRAPPQIEAIDGSEHLVTITIGGNDAATVSCWSRRACPAGALAAPARSHPARAARPRGAAAGRDVAIGRQVGDTLKRLTEAAATATGCELVRAGDASVDHHPRSDTPWLSRFGLPLPGRVAPLHPNAAGMRAVADLVVAAMG